jgi:hypothetical protein
MSCCISVRGDLNEGLAAIVLERKAIIQLFCWVCFLTVALMLLLPGGSLAQETRGTIQGRISDPSGAVVAGAVITAMNPDTNTIIKATSNAKGDFVLPLLLPRIYTVTTEATGFKSTQRSDIELRIHETLQLDFTLEVGSAAERVEVTGEPPLLEAASATIGQVMDRRRITELPISYGSPLTLMYLVPGLVNTYPTGMQDQEPTNMNATTTRMNVNGAPNGTTEFTTDGVPNTQTSNADFGGGMANSPPTDMVQEMKVETAYDASFGHTSGAIVNLILKTGTNQLHGSANFFVRDPNWAANTFFGNMNGQPRGDYSYKRWGGGLSGPIYIPKVYNGTNKTFFSYGFEGSHQNYIFQGSQLTVPDPRNIGGDFSNLLALGSNYQIYDPSTIQPSANGRYSIQPFPGNIIPVSRISPIALNILKHYPKPNVPGLADGTNNYSYQTTAEPIKYFNHVANFDHSISDKQRLSGRVSISRKIDGPYRAYWDDISVGQVYLGKTRQFSLDDVYVFSPSLVMNVRYGYIRYAGLSSPRRLGYDPSELGFSSGVVSLFKGLELSPNVNISGLTSIGTEQWAGKNNDIHALFVGFNKQQNNHNFKFGADVRAYRDNDKTWGNVNGSYTFGTAYTQGPFDNSPSSPNGMGQGLAAFLLDQPTSGYVDNNDSQAIQSTYWALYFHDNWRAARNLTIDLGLRWEYTSPLTERFDRSVRGFDPGASQPIAAQALANYAANPDVGLPLNQLQIKGGLLYAGVNGVPRELWDRTAGTFVPRIGFAYSATKRLVWRSGFGLYPISIGQSLQNRAITTGFDQQTSLIPTTDNGQHYLANLANPFPDGILSAPGASLGAQTYLGRSISFYDPRAQNPYVMHWSSNVQVLLPARMLLEVGYVGSKAVKLQTTENVNALPNQYLSTSPVRDQATINYLTAQVRNPFAGLLPGTSLNGSTIARSQLLVPYPQFTGVTMTNYQGYSWYHSLQARLERRMSKGFTVIGGYTWSKTMDAISFLNAGDPLPYRGISQNDRPQHLNASAIVELPLGRGRALLGSSGRVLDAVIGGWKVGTMWQFNSGQPLGFGNAIFTGNIKDIALPADQQTPQRWFNINGFNRNSSQQLASNLITLSPLFAGIRSDVYNQWDANLMKDFQIHEQHTFQFRAEFLNVFNHPTGFAPPNTSPTSTAFGTVSSQYGWPRTIQLGLKYLF